MRIWKFPDQVIRLTVLFIVAIVVLVFVRSRFVPATFGEIGHYRAEALAENASRPIRFAGWQACVECHPDVAEARAASYHRGVSCEACHSAAADHVADPMTHQPLRPIDRSACTHCHNYQMSRPTGFPQIIESLHNPVEPCITCHDPHDPTPPGALEECSACHAAIARTKAVSHHTSLSCETCHDAVPGHSENPRAHLPSKPTTRAFCGRCHTEGADSPAGIPRVDLDTHGSIYLCWQCHYPHFPEAR